MYFSLNKVIGARSNGVLAHSYFSRVTEQTSKISLAKYFIPFYPLLSLEFPSCLFCCCSKRKLDWVLRVRRQSNLWKFVFFDATDDIKIWRYYLT